jgi:hypothetical protein
MEKIPEWTGEFSYDPDRSLQLIADTYGSSRHHILNPDDVVPDTCSSEMLSSYTSETIWG